MALAEPQLALHPKDEEDVDFNDHLADDLDQGLNGLLRNFHEEEEAGGEMVGLGQALSEFSISHVDRSHEDNLIAVDQIWLRERLGSPSVVTVSRKMLEGDADKEVPSGILEESYGDNTPHDLSIQDANSDAGVHHAASLRENNLQNPAAHQDFIPDASAILDSSNYAVGNAHADLVSASSQTSKLDFRHPVSSQSVVKELQWSIFSQTYTPEDGSSDLTDFLSELDGGTNEFSDPSFTYQPAVQAGPLGTASTSSPVSDWKGSLAGQHINNSLSPSGISGSELQLYDYGGDGILCQLNSHQFQLDSKGSAFSSFSGSDEHLSAEPRTEQGGNGFKGTMDSASVKLNSGMHLQQDSDVLHEQILGTLLQQSEVSSSSSVQHSSLRETQLGGSYAGNGSVEAHQEVLSSDQQVYSAQSWDNMYPGWYFDYTTNEWKQAEGWDLATSSMSGQHCNSSTAGPDTYFTSSAPNTTVSQLELDQGISVVPSHLAFNGGHNNNAAYNEAAYVSRSVLPEQTALTGSAWSTEKLETVATSSVPFLGNEQMNLTAGYEQVTYDGASQYQLPVSWEAQYPGWYFDYQEQQWRQIMPEFAGHTGSSIIEPLEFRGDPSVKPDHQLITNPGTDWPVKGRDVYGRGVTETSLTENLRFHAWDAPSVSSNFDNPVSAKAGQVQEALQFESDMSTYEPHGYSNGARHYHKESEAASNNSYNQQRYNQSQSFCGPITETRFLSDKRPPHALVAFGFGGRLVTMKTSYNSTPGTIVLHDVSQLVQAAADNKQNDGVSYFSSLDRGGLAGPLVGGGLATKEVLKWVDDQISNCELQDSRWTDSLRVLWSVLRISCTHYGKLRPTHGSSSLKTSSEDGPEVDLGRLLSTSGHSSQVEGITAISSGLQAMPPGPQLQSIALEMRKQLVDGKRKEALQLAQQGQLWGPALVLASHLGEKAYAETVLRMAQQQFVPGCPLRTLILLLGGQTAELFTTMSLPAQVGAVPMMDSAGGMLGDWMGNLLIIAANPTNGDEQVLTHLGDCLWKERGEVAGAHICYLIADTNFESFSENARLCLVGADHFKWQRTFATAMAIQRTELYEYAKALGNPQFILLPFQPYKLLYAYMLVEAGKLSEARRYCQAVTKALKNAGRTSEIEFCRQAASALEERLRMHSQGGYNLNSATGKFVGKFIGTLDNTLHRIIGGLPPRQASEPSLNKNPRDWYSNDRKASNAAKGHEASILDPLSQNEKSGRLGNQQIEAPSRSISEPNLTWSPRKREQNSTTSAEADNAAIKENKTEVHRTGYLSRFGSQLLSRAVEFMKPTAKKADLGETNKFYYNKELKKWVEEGAEQTMEEMALPPPPVTGGFEHNSGTASFDTQITAGTEGPAINFGNRSLSSQMPPLPPNGNQYSARGRLNGVRSRYVDTFNKGGTLPATSTDSPVVSTTRLAPPTQFFMPVPIATSTDDSAKVSEERLLEFSSSLSASASAAMNTLLSTENEAVQLIDSFLNSAASFPVEKHSTVKSSTHVPKNIVTPTQVAGVFVPEATQLSSVTLANDIREIPGFLPTITSVHSQKSSVFPNGMVESDKKFADMKLDGDLHTAEHAYLLPVPPVLEGYNASVCTANGVFKKIDTPADRALPSNVNENNLTDLQEVEL